MCPYVNQIAKKDSSGQQTFTWPAGRRGGKGGRRKSSMALKYLRQKQFLQMLCKCLCFPDFPWEVLSAFLSFLGRWSSQCSVSCRVGPVRWGFLNPSFLSSWRIFAMMKILVSRCWAERPKVLEKCKCCSPSPLPSLALLRCHVFLCSSALALTHGYFSCNVPYHRAQEPSIMASKCTPRSYYFSLQTGDFN